jgi:hypothetical protein
MTWQPIETAPRDGTRVLVWMPKAAEPFIASWDTQKYHKRPQPYWRSTMNLGVSWDRMRQPTHWQPLPPPPDAT